MAVPIPSADTIPVAWGWFQFLLLLTFPLHLLAMNAMFGGLAVGVVLQFKNDQVSNRLAHRVAVMLPLVIAFVVNLGVAPLLFLQVLYGHFIYTSSVLIGILWILVVPVLIIAYYGAYLYDFRFKTLGSAGKWVGLLVLILLPCIGYVFSSNMLLMALPERFVDYFQHRDGSMLVSAQATFLPRYLHMMTGAVAVGSLFVALLGRFRAARDRELAEYAERVGMRTFFVMTLINVIFGTWYLLSLDREEMMLFMGADPAATACFVVALLMVVFILVMSFKKRLVATLCGTVVLVYLMSFLRSWLRSALLSDYFNLGQLTVVPQYSSMIFFFACLAGGLVCVGWLIVKTAGTLASEQ
jgi:hypothetical protein